MIYTTAILTTCVKLLLIPSYHSTDFEVHRNWLAITSSLPVKRWYFEETSEWTLDYPPLFAWFEYLLSFGAYFFDKEMLTITNLNYESDLTVLFQRLSVILTDLVFAYGVNKYSLSLKRSWRNDVVLPILLLTNCGLLMVDHVHFQYNGIMYGILLISIAHMMQNNYLKSAFWFTILLNMKHIYVYLAPAYFIFLLRHYCLKHNSNLKNLYFKLNYKNIVKLGGIVITIFFVTYFPFRDHLKQVLSRLFPFKRGLCHAYWAPNIWAIYNVVDKISYFVLSKFNIIVGNKKLMASMTGGLVQEFSHSFLPNVTPLVTMILTVVFMLPAMYKLFVLDKQPVHFLRCVVICALTSFLFGWHVHEKAILMAIIPLSLLSVKEPTDAKIFLILATVGHYSLFPLLFPNSLLVIKVFLLILYSIYAFHSLSKIYPLIIYKFAFPLLAPLEGLYLLGLSAVFFYENVIHHLLGLNHRLPFLPLMITSVYCSLGVLYCWIRYYLYFLYKNLDNSKIKDKVN